MSNVVKSQAAGRYQSALVFEMTDIEAQAASIVAAAQARARDIVSAAQMEGDAMRSRAEAEGRQAGLDAGKVEGEKLGRADGRSAAFAQAQKDLSLAVEGLLAACAQLAALKDDLFALAETDLLKFSLLVARKIVAGEVAAQPHVAAANVKRCLDLLSQHRNLVVRVAPSAISIVEERMPELARRMGDLSSVKIMADPAVSPGGCLVTAESGVLDATVETQFAEVERILFGEPNA